MNKDEIKQVLYLRSETHLYFQAAIIFLYALIIIGLIFIAHMCFIQV